VAKHDGPMTSAEFNFDGTRVVTTSVDRTARVWDATGYEPTVSFDLGSAIRRAAFTADGKRAVTVSDDNTARIWEIATRRLVAKLEHPDLVHSASFNSDGDRVVTTCNDQMTRIWDVSTGLVRTQLEHPGHATTATFSPDGARVITVSADEALPPKETVRVWNAATGERIALALAFPDRISSARSSANGNSLVTVNQLGIARVWRTATGK